MTVISYPRKTTRVILRTDENESLRRPCKSASTQIISSPENSDYFSFAETSRENFAILARIKLSTISRLSAQCWSILLHSTDKNWSSQRHINTKLFSQNLFYKIRTDCQRPGLKREDRSAPAIQYIWAMKRNIWTRPIKKLQTCLFNMLIKKNFFQGKILRPGVPSLKFGCSTNRASLHPTDKCSLSARAKKH